MVGRQAWRGKYIGTLNFESLVAISFTSIPSAFSVCHRKPHCLASRGGGGAQPPPPGEIGYISQIIKASLTKFSDIFCLPILLDLSLFEAKSHE